MRNSFSSVPTPKIKHVDACKFGVIYFWFHCQFLASYLYVYSFHVTVDATIIKILHDFTASPIVNTCRHFGLRKILYGNRKR